jgi:hypothetical protein
MVSDALRPEAPEQNRSTHFVFDHAAFRTPMARFALAVDGTPSMLLRLADLDAVVPIKSLAVEFGLEGTPDAQLLDQVVAGLKHVKVIRPGDSIPREILDGTASWSIEDHHYEMAKGRITLQISSWITGNEQVTVDPAALIQLAEDPAIKARVQEAFSEIAVKLQLPRDQRQAVIDRIDQVARELSFIEALRERFGLIQQCQEKIHQFHKIYRRDRSIEEELLRLDTLIRRPVEEISNIFDQLDAQCGEIISLLRNLDRQIAFIRESRDDLHQRMMIWDEILDKWLGVPLERSTENEQIMKELYRFLARHFIIERPWQLANSAYDRR